MKLHQLMIAAIAAGALSGAASAAVMTSSTGSPVNVISDYSAPSQVAFDLDLQNFSSTRLNFIIEEADLLGPMSMNALVRNLSGTALTNFTFSLEGIAFSMAGSVTPTFGTIGRVTFKDQAAGIEFGQPEWAEFHFGNPLAAGNRSDWFFNTTGLRAGDAFSITATVPEPSTLMLVLSAIAMAGVYGASKRSKR